MTIFIFWIVFAFVGGLIAEKKGRSGGGFLLLGLLLSPIIGLIAALIAAPNTKVLEKRSLTRSGGMRKCPACAELVKSEATICRYCGKELPTIIVAPEPPPVAIMSTGPPPKATIGTYAFLGILIAAAMAAAWYVQK